MMLSAFLGQVMALAPVATAPVRLHCVDVGSARVMGNNDHPPIVILHGLFGAGQNFNTVR